MADTDYDFSVQEPEEVRPVDDGNNNDNNNGGNNNQKSRIFAWVGGAVLMALLISAVASCAHNKKENNQLREQLLTEQRARDMDAANYQGAIAELNGRADSLVTEVLKDKASLAEMRDSLALTRDSLANCRKAKKATPRTKRKATPKPQPRPAAQPVTQPVVVPAQPETVYVPQYNQPVVVNQVPAAPTAPAGQTTVNVNNGAQNTTVNVNNGTVNNYYGAASQHNPAVVSPADADTLPQYVRSKCVIETQTLTNYRQSR